MSERTKTIAGVVAASAGIALILRAVKRRLSPDICCKLSCKCGKVEGTICAKKEDSIRIYCYCEDCRRYARYIAGLGNKEDATIGEYGDSRVVQVCKSAVTITKGREYLKLARKAPPDGTNSTRQIYMHRFYASCCYVPLLNTVDFLGFVGVFTDFLDENHKKYAGPVCMFSEEALKDPKDRESNIFVPDFLWKLIRYLPYRNSGPFDYDILDVVYWGVVDDRMKKGQ